jgi:hypothetical protein
MIANGRTALKKPGLRRKPEKPSKSAQLDDEANGEI